MASDCAVRAGTSPILLRRLTRGAPPHEGPEVPAEAAGLAPHGQEGARVRDGRRDLEPVSHDARVREEPADVPGAVGCDPLRVEAVEGAAVSLALRKHDAPAEAGLRALERQQLEERSVVPLGHAPLGVVIGDVERLLWPRTPLRFSLHRIGFGAAP
jgi:hypothetical protein